MLFVLFQAGKDRYALPATRVVEVTPMVSIRPLPLAPHGVAGVFTYRGRSVPAIDMSKLLLNTPATELLSTRIIVTEWRARDGRRMLVGLVAEHATELLRVDAPEASRTAAAVADSPFLGSVVMDAKGPVQLLLESQILPEPVRTLLAENTMP